MKFALIICTYMRPKPVLQLLQSVEGQYFYPDEIIIVDGSLNSETAKVLNQKTFKNVQYHLVAPESRGLTKQRNYGVGKVSETIDIVCFLDDDIILTKTYFKNLIETYNDYPEAVGVGGYIINEVNWRKLKPKEKTTFTEYEIDGYVRNLGSRNVIRKKLGLLSNRSPCFMPKYSNGFSVGNLPPNNKIYEAEYFYGRCVFF